MKIDFKRILCPTDLSPESDEALRYAIDLALAYEAKLIVCHCVGSSPPADESKAEQIKRLIEETIRDHISLVNSPALIWESVVVTGEPADVIAREAAEREVDLIVMRTRHRPYAAALLGSTAETVSRMALCPILVTPSRPGKWLGFPTGDVNLRRLLVAYDFSEDSELALASGLSLAQEYQAELHLIHVLSPGTGPEPPEGDWRESPGDRRFQKVARLLQTAVPAEALLWCKIKQAVKEGKPYREVLTYAEEQEIDLICMGMRGAGFGLHTLFGSNTDRVLRQAPCPVFIARPLKVDVVAMNEDIERMNN
jgi:nucleotide-binding universal stress UspA family protein